MTGDEVYADPSALCRLFLNQDGGREMSAWRRRGGGSLPVTHHGRREIVNTICRAGFAAQLYHLGRVAALSELDEDFATGRFHQADLLGRAALNRTAELSRSHIPALGTRADDVLHVACALELKLRHFLTFDDRQRRLAAAVGLKLIKLS